MIQFGALRETIDCKFHAGALYFAINGFEMTKAGGKKKKKGGAGAITALFVILGIVAVVVAGGMGWLLWQQNTEREAKAQARQQKEAERAAFLAAHPYPTTIVNDSVAETVRAAAKNGWVPCPGDCLKLATPGWRHKDIKGFAATDWWMIYPYDGGWQAFSHRHAGHIIEIHNDKPSRDVGQCPICEGKGWVRKDSKI